MQSHRVLKLPPNQLVYSTIHPNERLVLLNDEAQGAFSFTPDRKTIVSSWHTITIAPVMMFSDQRTIRKEDRPWSRMYLIGYTISGEGESVEERTKDALRYFRFNYLQNTRHEKYMRALRALFNGSPRKKPDILRPARTEKEWLTYLMQAHDLYCGYMNYSQRDSGGECLLIGTLMEFGARQKDAATYLYDKLKEFYG